jgi:hypothetical protein
LRHESQGNVSNASVDTIKQLAGGLPGKKSWLFVDLNAAIQQGLGVTARPASLGVSAAPAGLERS